MVNTQARIDEEIEDYFGPPGPRKSIPPRPSPGTTRRTPSANAMDGGILISPGRSDVGRPRRRSLEGSELFFGESGKLESPLFTNDAAAERDGDGCAALPCILLLLFL